MRTSFIHLIDSCQQSFEQHTLYVVATPIGNVADITARALAAFSIADVVCAEDTRVTGQLLSTYGISVKKLVSVRAHNEGYMSTQIIQWLQRGLIVVQVCDAGTPTISDPGARVVEAARQAGFQVCPIPGVCAAIAALSVSGLPGSSFLFHGFLPSKPGERQRQLSQWQTIPHSIVCYEAPHRIIETLTDIVTQLGGERIVLLARELTKRFETIKALPAAQMLQWVSTDFHQQRGEMVLLIATPNPQPEHGEFASSTLRTLQILAAELPTKQAALLTAKLTGASKNALYEHALTIKSAKKSS